MIFQRGSGPSVSPFGSGHVTHMTTCIDSENTDMFSFDILRTEEVAAKTDIMIFIIYLY